MATFTPDAVASTLGTPEGETSSTLAARLARALGFIDNWYRATERVQDTWWPRLDDLRNLLADTLEAVERDAPFPGETAVIAYNSASISFASMYETLFYRTDQVDKSFLHIASDFVETVAGIPGGIGSAIAKVAASPQFTIIVIAIAAIVAYFVIGRRK